MAELIKHIESMADDVIESEETTYEKLLQRMFIIDEDLPLKTQIANPLEFAKYHQIAHIIEMENEVLKDEAELMRNLGYLLMIYSISYNREGRKEGFNAIESFNVGKMIQRFKYTEKTDEFKRITKKNKD